MAVGVTVLLSPIHRVLQDLPYCAAFAAVSWDVPWWGAGSVLFSDSKELNCYFATPHRRVPVQLAAWWATLVLPMHPCASGNLGA